MRLVILLLLLLVAGCGMGHTELVCYAGPNMRTSVEALARVYKQRTGVSVHVDSDEPRRLIDRIVASRSADLFVSHDPFLAMLIARGIGVRDARTVASLTPVIAVPKGNPRNIAGLEDLARPGLRVGLTDAETSISGHIVTLMLKKAGISRQVEANVVLRAPQGRDLAAALVAGQIDAAIVWNAVVAGSCGQLEAVAIDAKFRPARNVDAIVDSASLGRLELDYVRVTVATLDCSKNPVEARSFANFLASGEGTAVFLKNGLSPPDLNRPTLPGR